MQKFFFILLTLLSSTAHAEVFKCEWLSGKIIYQSAPCPSAIKQETIDIKPSDPREMAEAEAKLKTWEEGFAIREAARTELQAELDRKETAALQRNSIYQQQQAEAQRSFQQYSPYYYNYPTYQTLRNYPSHLYHQHNISEPFYTNSAQTERINTKNSKDNDNHSGRVKIMFKYK